MADKDQNESKSQASDGKKDTSNAHRDQTAENGTHQAGANHSNAQSGAVSAIDLLKADHRDVEKMFSAFESASKRAEKEKIARKVCESLIIHTILEEEIFYPACKEHVEDDMLDEAQVEHDSAKFLIQDILSNNAENHFYAAKVSVLAEQIKHHVAEEEKRSDGMFTQAKAGGVDTEELVKRMQARKAELLKLAEQDELPRPRTRSMMAQQNQPEMQERHMRGADRDRDDYGRFTSQDDDRGNYRQQGRSQGSQSGRDRDNQGGRYRDDDDRRQDRGRMPERDENGRFMSDDNRGYGSRNNRDDNGRYARDDDNRRGQGARSGQGQGRRYENEDDDRGRQNGGWFGDSDGHSQASRAGWRNSSHEGSGWYGDPEGHSEASRRGWEGRESSSRGGGGQQRYREDDEGGRYGQSRSASAGGRMRDQDDDDDDRRRSNQSRSGNSGNNGHSGWYGDPEGHSEASRRGWNNRR